MDPQYDVFLSYNTLEQNVVAQIASKLQQRKIKVWFDDWEVPPGTSLVQIIDSGMRASRSTAVFVGKDKLGPWQNPEIEAAIRLQIRKKKSIITVLLPGLTDDPDDFLPGFLLNSRYVDFRTGLENEKQWSNLEWGITGNRPEPEKPELHDLEIGATAEGDPVEEAISDLIQILKVDNITFFLGPGATYGAEPMPAQASEIARGLLAELRIIQDNYKELLPPFDVASLYYGVRSGDRLLEQTVNRLAGKSKVFPKTHDCLATLLKLLAKRPERRSRGRNLQLIVTTNLDLMAERALLRAGLPFTRVVQYRSAQQMDVSEYRHVQLVGDNKVQLLDELGQPQQASRDNFDELDQLITNGGSRPEQQRDAADRESNTNPIRFKELRQPILYKFLGSQDIDNSCVISTLHHFEFARSVVQNKALPEELTCTITNSTILFLGLWFMDPDFRLTYYTLLRDAMQMENDRRYALQLPPNLFAEDAYRRMERGIWQKIKEQGTRQMGITAIEEPCDVFLEKLYNKVQSELGLRP